MYKEKQIDDSVNKLRKEPAEPRTQNIIFSNDYRKNNRGNTRFNGPRNQGYQPRDGYSNYNPRFNRPNYQQQNTSFNDYGNRFTQSYETFPQQNTYRNNEPNPEQQQDQPQQGASFYAPNRNNSPQQRQSKPNNIQKQPNQKFR